MVYIYKKNNLQGVALIDKTMSDTEIHQNIKNNILSIYGGSIDDYAYIETDYLHFHLEKKNSEVVVIKDEDINNDITLEMRIDDLESENAKIMFKLANMELGGMV